MLRTLLRRTLATAPDWIFNQRCFVIAVGTLLLEHVSRGNCRLLRIMKGAAAKLEATRTVARDL